MGVWKIFSGVGGQQFIYPGTGVAKDFSGGKNGEISFYALDESKLEDNFSLLQI